jgi:GrpB-like predicted nucleotidyltransferase (UPF0157 family)
VSTLPGPLIADYDPDWPHQAAIAISALRAALPDWFVELEHIGPPPFPASRPKPSST